MSEEATVPSIDTTGITVTGKAADVIRLIQQFGMPTVILGVFLALFVGGAVVVRSDFLRQDADRNASHERQDSERTQSHERIIKDNNERHERAVKSLVDTYKEERDFDRAARSREWQQLHDLDQVL